MSDYQGTSDNDVLNQASLGLPDWSTIRGGAGDDTITVGKGTMLGQQGNDTLTGTSPQSMAAYWDSPAPIAVDLAAGRVQDGWGTVDTLVGIRVVTMSYGSDTALGSDGDDTFWEGGGSNTIDGGRGDDTVIYFDARPSEADITYDAASRTFTVVKRFANGITGTDILRNIEGMGFKSRDGNIEPVRVEDFTGPFRSHVTTAIPAGDSVQHVLTGDFNGDGRADLLIAHIHNPSIGDVASPVQVLLGNGAGGFTDGSAQVFGGVVPAFHYAARVAVADFNADGVTDLFVPDFGPDHAPFAGGQNRLFVSAGGVLADRTAQLEQRLMTAHGVSIGDVDGNGSADILVNAINDLAGKADQVIFNDGHGRFTTASALFPATVQQAGTYAEGHTWSYVGDLNGDRIEDMVLGVIDGGPRPSQVLLASAPGVFPASGVRALPFSGVDDELVLAITPIDLNGDRLDDLVLSITNAGAHGPLFHQEDYLQFLVNRGDGSFTDETRARFAQDPADRAGAWPKFVEVIDFNGDGADDILAASHGKAQLLLNDGAGRFAVARAFGGYGITHAVDVDGDAIPEIVGANQDSITVFDNDIFTGNANGGLSFRASERPEQISGGAGIDRVSYAGPAGGHDVRPAGAGWSVSSSGFDIDRLSGIERLQFDDGKLALDLQGHAGTVARFLGAVFGPAAVSDATYVGIGLSFADAGMGEETLMGLALGVRLGAAPANAAVVTALYTNVIGSAPPASDLAYYTGLLDSGAFSQAGLARMAAETSFNLTRIGFTGLVESGLAYV